jgi:phage terminase large subunit-like protein
MAVPSRSSSQRTNRTTKFKLNDGQIPADALFANPALRHICLVGGSRSGKTFFIVRAIMTRALKAEGSRHAILRFRANAARQSIWNATLPEVNRICFPEHRFTEHRQDGFWEGPNKSQIWIGGLDDKERVEKILGNEYVTIFLNECSQIGYPAVLMVRTRLAQVVPGLMQRMYYDLNPVGKLHWSNELFGNRRDPVSKKPLVNPDQYGRLFLNPEQNRANLSKEYLDELRNEANERHRKRFYEGVYVDEVAGALWTYEGIEKVRCTEDDLPELSQTVVIVDPSGATEKSKEADVEVKPKNDEIGIVVASLGVDGRVYLRKDHSLIAGPETWGKTAIAAYHFFKADRIVAEVNFGGGMVEYVIKSLDPNVPVKCIRANPGQGKHVRAEPVSTLYAKDRIRHVGKFSDLEDQLCAFTSLGYGGPKSPDRADGWIWGVTDLVLQDSGAEGWLEYYRQLAEKEGIKIEAGPEYGFEITPEAKKKHAVLVPDGVSTVYLIDGTCLIVPNDRIINVSEEDAAALGRRGWERLA